MNTEVETRIPITWRHNFKEPDLPAGPQPYDHGLHPYVRLAGQLVQEYDLPMPHENELVRIVRAALDARAILLAHAHYGQDPIRLELMLQDFVLFCLQPVGEKQVF